MPQKKSGATTIGAPTWKTVSPNSSTTWAPTVSVCKNSSPFSTGPPRGGGVWGSQAGWIDNGIYVTTGNSNIGGPNPTPNHALSLLRLDAKTGSIVWGWQPVPYDLDQDPDWSATP